MVKRKPNRLREYDYSRNGAYFITLCIKDRHEMLWKNVGARIARPQDTENLSEYGLVIRNAINNIPERYPCVSVDKYVIMPNHLHMILLLNSEGEQHVPTISTVINQMKGYVTKQIGFSLWQKLFHDHIIRNEAEYEKIWEYIDTNPMSWRNDCYFRNNKV